MGRHEVGITRLLSLQFGREDIYTYYCLLEKVTSGSEDKHPAQGCYGS